MEIRDKYFTQRVNFKENKMSLTEMKLERTQNSREKADMRQSMNPILVAD
jgi:hypothetical protein